MTPRTGKEDGQDAPVAPESPRRSRERLGRRLIFTAIWLSTSLVAGFAGHVLFKLNFGAASLIAALALTINGVVAEWEDRRER